MAEKTLSSFSSLQFEGYGVEVSEADRAGWYEQRTRQAQSAFEQGQICLKRKDLWAALFWLGRAERLSGRNPHVIMSCAMTALELGQWAEALKRLEWLRAHCDAREAAFAFVMCLYRLGRVREAAVELASILSHYTMTEEFFALAGKLALIHEAGGWASLSNTGHVTLSLDGMAELVMDGKSLGPYPAGVHQLPTDWFEAERLSIKIGKQHVLGSPFDIRALTRCDSLVRPEKDGIRGWLWYPAEPFFTPSVFLEGRQDIPLEKGESMLTGENPVWQPYVFFIPHTELPAAGKQPVSLRDHYNRPLLGTPIDPRIGRLLEGRPPFPAHLRPVPVKNMPMGHGAMGNMMPSGGVGTGGIRRLRKRDYAVIIPVYRNYQETLACLQSVLETVPDNIEIIVVDDATPEAALAQMLDRLAAEKRITLLRHKENRGFPASVNHALRRIGQRDAILLNSDTVVFDDWTERLCAWLRRDRTIGTVTPFSNDSGLLSYPSVEVENPVLSVAQARKMDELCKALSDGRVVDLPTANGFCMAISNECLTETGLLREDVFSQGYGEENDFCLRATARGFRHVAATDIYVRHLGGASFQEGKKELISRNLEILNALHPGYDQLIAAFQRRNPLHLVRRKLDQVVLGALFSPATNLETNSGHPGDIAANAKAEAEKAEEGLYADKSGLPKILSGSVVMIEHNAGGGVARTVRERAEQYRRQGILALSLRPALEGCVLEVVSSREIAPNLTFALPTEGGLLAAFLRRLNVRLVEWHHLLGHAPWVRRLHRFLDVPYEVFIHDHIWFCPRIVLLNTEEHYCGEPDLRGCQACLAHGDAPQENLPLMDLLERSVQELGAAQRVVTACTDSARRLLRHIKPGPLLVVEPWEDEQILFSAPRVRREKHNIRRIGVVGGISSWKGYHVLKELGQYIQDRNFPLEIVVIGSTENDDDLLAVGIKVTGEYKEEDALPLIRQQNLDLGFISSIAPETWCYALSRLWQAGLDVVGFDIGAVGERIQRSGRGAVLPLGLPVERLAACLLTYCS